MGNKAKYYRLPKTELQNVVFELKKARGMYADMNSQRACCRVYMIDRLLERLNAKLKEE